MSIIRILAVVRTQILQLANYANDAKTIAWSIKRDKWTHMLLRILFRVQGPTHLVTISGTGQIARMCLANNSKMHRAQGIFPLPSFCPTYYGLSNVMRRKGTRHAFIECRVTARECDARGRDGVNGEEEDAAEQ